MSDFYVDPVYGLDTNPGTNLEPFQTFHKAMTSGFGAPASEDDVHFIYSNPNAVVNIFVKGGTCPVAKGYYFYSGSGVDATTNLHVYGTGNSILLLDNDFFVVSDYFLDLNSFCYADFPSESFDVYWSMENIIFVNLSAVDIKFLHGKQFGLQTAGANELNLKNCSFRGITELFFGEGSKGIINIQNCSVADPCTPATLINAANEFTVTQLKNSVGTDYVEIVSNIAKAKSSESIIGNGAFLPLNSGNYSFDPLFTSNGWIDDASYLDGRPTIAEDAITILSGDSCRVLSPVFNYPDKLRSSLIYVKATEDESGGPGHNQVVDSTPLTIDRTIEVRYSDTAFLQTDPTPEWITISRGVCDTIEGKYVQFRVTLITNGA